MSVDRYEQMNLARKRDQREWKVAAYCRVSTDHQDQANSFASQSRYFTQYILGHPDWTLYEVFADEGLSGTTTKKRDAFNRMICLAKQGAFQLVVTKEISRFARNTLDSIYYTRELKRYGVGVIFLNDGIHTMDGDSELRLAIMSSIAQEESRRTSQRVKWGQRRQMEQGVVFGRDMLGYDVRNGQMIVNEKGAEVVRCIFRKFLEEGKGTGVIARELTKEGIQPMRAKAWHSSVILRILRNEKYCGDLVQKKTFTPDYLSHEKKYNHGQEDFVILRDHHAPIISREDYRRANEILDRRREGQCGIPKFSAKSPFSGKIRCTQCGGHYVLRQQARKDGSVYRSWRCQGHQQLPTGSCRPCPGRAIPQEAVNACIRDILQWMQNNGQIDVQALAAEMMKICPEADDNRIAHLIRRYLSGAEKDEAFYAALTEEIQVDADRSIHVRMKGGDMVWHFHRKDGN